MYQSANALEMIRHKTALAEKKAADRVLASQVNVDAVEALIDRELRCHDFSADSVCRVTIATYEGAAQATHGLWVLDQHLHWIAKQYKERGGWRVTMQEAEYIGLTLLFQIGKI